MSKVTHWPTRLEEMVDFEFGPGAARHGGQTRRRTGFGGARALIATYPPGLVVSDRGCDGLQPCMCTPQPTPGPYLRVKSTPNAWSFTSVSGSHHVSLCPLAGP